MGVLGAAAMNGQGTDPPAPDDAETPEVETTETPETKEPEAGRDEAGRFVPESNLQPKTPGSRQSRAERKVEERLKAWDAERAAERTTYQQQIAEAREQIARMSGQLEAVSNYQRSMPAQSTAPAGPSPEELTEKATAALDAGKFSEYQKYTKEAFLAEARRERQAELAALRQEIPQPINPEIQYLMAQHKNVAMAGERGARLVMVKDQELEWMGIPRGRERVRRAFEMADKMLATPPPANGYDASAAGALSGVTPGGANGKTREPGVTLNKLQLEAAAAAKMSPEDYVKWGNPQKYLGK